MDMAVRFCQELLPSLEDSVVSELKCSSCNEIMRRPVYHCERGHSFCKSCYSIGNNCQFCGANNTGTRTHHLERILDNLTYPCKYFGNGCQKRFQSNKLKQHEQECQTFKFQCPMRLGTKCTFAGTKKQIVFHCQLIHSEFTLVGNNFFKQQILHKATLPATDLVYSPSFYLYCVKDVLFQAMIQLDPDKLRVRICRLSPPSEADDPYKCLIKLSDCNNRVVRSFYKPCGVTNGWQEPLVNIDGYLRVDLRVWGCCKYFSIEFS